MGITLNAGQQAAVDAIRSGRNVFVTGEGGTGKSVAIRKAVNLLRYDGRKTVLCAPTGIAAQNIGGATIHSVFRFNMAPKVADQLEATQPSKVVHEADTIIIDEIGMVRRDLMDAIALAVDRENEIRENDPRKKHLQLVVVGDFSQLPPVVTDKDKPALVASYGQASATSGFYAFEADGWKRMGFALRQLTEPMRQSDPVFVQMLNRARVGDTSCLPYFNKLASRAEMPNEAVSIVPTNKAAARINAERLRALDGRSERFAGKVAGEFQPKDMAAPDPLELKKGARVMTVAGDREGSYINGSTGTVADLHGKAADGTPAIIVELDGGGRVAVAVHTWENTVYEVVSDGEGGKKRLRQTTIGTYAQYPLKLAYAITYHKSQGQTMRCVSIDPSTFAPGQLYVGLSRATSAGGIYLTKEIGPDDLQADEAVVAFYENACGWTAPEPPAGDESPVLDAPPAPEESVEPESAVVSNSNKRKKKQPISLGSVQRELHRLLGDGGRTWVRVYELVDLVREKELYRPDFRSFSAWVKEEARREGVTESVLWHRRSAGDFYRAWASRHPDAPELGDAQHLSEDNLNLVRKISQVDAERGDELMREMIERGLSTKRLRAELRERKREAAAAAEAGPAATQPTVPVRCERSGSRVTMTFPDADTIERAYALLRDGGIELEIR